MLGIGCPDRHALLRITSPKLRRPRRLLPSRERVRSSTPKRSSNATAYRLTLTQNALKGLKESWSNSVIGFGKRDL
jgi:hypothetical protein